MGLHVGGIYVKVKEGVTQKKVAEYIKSHWLKLGAKLSKKDPLQFDRLNLSKSGELGFAIFQKTKINKEEWIDIFDSERYTADPFLAKNLANYFDTDVWLFYVVDSSNYTYAKRYGKNEKVLKKYDDVMDLVDSHGFVMFDGMGEWDKKDLEGIELLAFEDVPHRPDAKYSGPSKERLDLNNYIELADNYWHARNAEAIIELAKKDEGVYREHIRDLIKGTDFLDFDKKKDQEFLYKLSPLTFDKKLSTLGSTLSIAENALRMDDDEMFEKAVESIPSYALFELPARALQLYNEKNYYIAFRLIEAQSRKSEDSRIINDAVGILCRIIAEVGEDGLNLPKKRIDTLIKKAEKYGPRNTSIYHNLVCFYTIQNDFDNAFAAIKNAIKYGYAELDKLKEDKDISPLKKDPRFEEVFK